MVNRSGNDEGGDAIRNEGDKRDRFARGDDMRKSSIEGENQLRGKGQPVKEEAMRYETNRPWRKYRVIKKNCSLKSDEKIRKKL